jgi:hypothetical protein
MGTDSKSADQKSTVNLPPIDSQGIPTTYLSFMILKLMFSELNRWFTPEDLSKLLAAKHSDTDSICRQLKLMDLINEDPLQIGRYRYNLNTTNVNTQTDLECFLADVELNNLPVHLMLDYSPSYRPPAHLHPGRL